MPRTDLDTLIERVLSLDVPSYSADRLILYRAAAPALARALRVAVEALRAVRENRGDMCKDALGALDEIEFIAGEVVANTAPPLRPAGDETPEE